jgi:small subunit ribosomal protein S6
MSMKSYETVMVFSVKNGEEAVNALWEKFKSMIEDNGTIESVDQWGKRKLAYPINYETEGYYVVVNYSANTDFTAELARRANITDGVLRYLTVAK